MASEKIMIYLPVFNSAKTITNVFDRIPNPILKKVHTILIVDNKSKDKSLAKVNEYQKKHKNFGKKIKIIKNKVNKGYGGSQKVAYKYALENKFDIVVMLHSDGQYAPELLPKLLKPILAKKIEMVFGSRMEANPLKGGMPLYKFLGNKALTFVENILLGTNLSEFHSGYRIYRCDALKQLPLEKCSSDYHFDTDILIMFKHKNLRIGEVPIPTFYGDEICYVNCVQYGLNVLFSVFDYKLHTWKIKKSKKFNF